MKHSFKVGDKVQSHFRATWKGVIVEGPDKNECYIVKILIYQHNNIMRKPKFTSLNHHWLTPTNFSCIVTSWDEITSDF